MEKKNILDDDRIARLLFRLSFPAFIGMAVMTLYNVVDTIFIGHFVGTLGIAALAIVFPVQMMASGIGHLMGMGGASLISRLIGADDVEGANLTLGNAVFGTFVLSSCFMITALSLIDPFLVQLGASETILPFARDYMKIILVGFFFRPFAMLFHNLIRSEGNARAPMTGMIIGAVLNTLLDAVFIIGFRFGIKGAAMATVVGEAVTTLYFISYYFSGRNFLRFKIRNFIVQWPVMREILSIGISAFTMSVATSLSVIFVNKMCAAYGGDMAVSAFGIVNRLIMFALMPGLVVGMGLQPIVGFNYGAKRFERILRAIFISAAAATFFCTVSFVLGCFFPEIFIKVFTSDKTLIALTAYAIKRIFSAIFIVGLIFVISTIFQALGKATPAFFTSVARPVLFFIPLLYLLPRYMKLDGVWWAFPFADILTFMLATTLVFPQINQLYEKRKENAFNSNNNR